MSTEIETKFKEHLACTFWGGDKRGRMIQITSIADGQHLLLSLSESAEMMNVLAQYIKAECFRRQSLLKEEIAEQHLLEKSVFREIADIKEIYLEVQTVCVSLVDKFCPVIKKDMHLQKSKND